MTVVTFFLFLCAGQLGRDQLISGLPSKYLSFLLWLVPKGPDLTVMYNLESKKKRICNKTHEWLFNKSLLQIAFWGDAEAREGDGIELEC